MNEGEVNARWYDEPIFAKQEKPTRRLWYSEEGPIKSGGVNI